MRKLAQMVAVLLVFVPGLAFAANVDCVADNGKQECSKTFTASSTNTSISVPFLACGIFKNKSSDKTAYVSTFGPTASTTTSHPVAPGERWGQCIKPSKSFGVITSGSDTASVQFDAIGGNW